VTLNLIEYDNTIMIPELKTGLEFGIITEPNYANNLLGYVTDTLP